MSRTDHAMQRFILCLELMGGLTKAAETTGCQWTFGEWWKVLQKLDPIDARCLILRLIHGMEWEEMGERIGVSRARVAQRFERALKTLKKQRQVIQMCA